MLPTRFGQACMVGQGVLLQCSAAALSLLRGGEWQPLGRAVPAGVRPSASAGAGGSRQTQQQQPPSAAADGLGQAHEAGCRMRPQLLAGRGTHALLAQAGARLGASAMHHAAAAAVDYAVSSDEDSSQQQQQQGRSWHNSRPLHAAAAAAGRGAHAAQRGAGGKPPLAHQQHGAAHHHQHQQQLHHLVSQLHHAAPPSQQQQQQPAAATHHAGGQGRYQGHLHAPHGRRHATTSGAVDRFISEQLLSSKSLGMLRRIMIKHKATMEPEHVADTLLCLQHLVLAARAARRGGPGAATAAAAGAGGNGGGAPHHHATSQARAQPRVRATGEFSTRSKPRTSESDGHMEQLVAQMCGELGNMIWFMMGDMTGPDLAKIIFSWASIGWHPEPELLADVKASFIAAAAGGGVQRHAAAAPAAAGSRPPQQQQQQQQPEAGLWQQPWLAAGLWGLAKLNEPLEGQLLQLLQHHWEGLLALWTPQQLCDIAGALAVTADEQVAAAAAQEGGEALAADVLQKELAPIVFGLARQLVLDVLQEEQGGEEAGEPYVPLPWPEAVLVQLQSALYRPAPGAHKHTGGDAASGGAAPPLAAVHNVPHLAWRMLQSLAAVGVNISEPEDPAVGAIIAALSAATKTPPRRV